MLMNELIYNFFDNYYLNIIYFRTYGHNLSKSTTNTTLSDKNKIYDSNESTSPSDAENQHRNYQQKTNDGKLVMLKFSTPKKRRVEEYKQSEQTFLDKINMNSKIMNMENPKLTAADNAFMEFIKIQFASIPEHEKNNRRKLIMDAISVPL